jgi:hypothetical protein
LPRDDDPVFRRKTALKEEHMSKRYSILAAALVASGRSSSTTFLDKSAALRPDSLVGRIDELSIEERSRRAFANPEEWQPGRDPAMAAVLLASSWPLS